MTEEGRRVLRPGHRIALGPDVYTVIQINGTAVTLLDERGDLSAMMLGYLLTVSGFKAPPCAPSSSGLSPSIRCTSGSAGS